MDNGLPAQKILIVDDTPENIDILAGILGQDYKIKFAINGKKALEIVVGEDPPDLVLLDIKMPGIDGYEVCRRIKRHGGLEDLPVIFVTADMEAEAERKGFEAGGVDYITKPFNIVLVKERVKTHLALYDQNRELEKKAREKTIELTQALESVKQASLETIHRLSRAAEYRDEDTGAHLHRMCSYSAAVAERMGASKEEVDSLFLSAQLHDIGKIGVPDQILLKPEKLNRRECDVMMRHTAIGGEILENADSKLLRTGRQIALTHHEKWDGSGYPRGLKGLDIPLPGRITAIADVFDALTSRRPYKEPFSVEKSCAIIKQGRENHFDPDVVDAFFSAEHEILKIKEEYQDAGESLLYRAISKLE